MNIVCCFHSGQPNTAPHAVFPFISTLDSQWLSLIHRSPYRTVEVQWSDRKWKMNLSHQEQRELPLRGGFQPAPLLTGLMNLHFPSTPDKNGFNQMHHCSIFQRYRRHFTNERRDISTSTSARLYPTGCRCDSSFCLVDNVNRIQWWRKYSNISLLDANTTVS